MNPNPLNRFLDFNHDGKIDETEEFIGYMIMQEVTKEEDEAEEEVCPTK